MHIGLICEGKNDKNELTLLIKRIIKSINANKKAFIHTHTAQGTITEHTIRVGLAIFENDSRCTLVIVISDNEDQRCKDVRNLIDKNFQNNTSCEIIFVCANPKIEYWYIKEETSIKKVLKLLNTQQLPFAEMKDPKERLNRIIKEYNSDITTTPTDIRHSIIEELNLKSLKKISSFKKLHNELKRLIK